MTFIGIDNGVSGTIGILHEIEIGSFGPMPVKKVLNYTKAKQFLHRVDGSKLSELLRTFWTVGAYDGFCLLERPMINPKRWKASVSAIRALEATETILEILKIPYAFIDSRKWQKALLPNGLKKEELKFASLQVAKRLFPMVNLDGYKDADGLLIAEYCRRKKESYEPK